MPAKKGEYPCSMGYIVLSYKLKLQIRNNHTLNVLSGRVEITTLQDPSRRQNPKTRILCLVVNRALPDNRSIAFTHLEYFALE